MNKDKLFSLYFSPLNVWNIFIDPYALVSFDHFSKTSFEVEESICPTWNQTLLFCGVPFYGNRDMVKESPPPIVIELFDKDTVVWKLQMLTFLSPPVVWCFLRLFQFVAKGSFQSYTHL